MPKGLKSIPKLLLILFHFSFLAVSVQEEEVPTTFGLITVTHTRGGDNSQFMKYLDRYATMDCPIVTEINIVWNNERSMEEMGIYQNKSQWKRAIHFYRTPSNSMNWRFKIAQETKSQVFFSIDDDITVDCEELKKGFQVWQKNAIGSIGPIVSYGPRYYEYSLNKGFQYGRGKTKNVFNIGLVGLAFISRHFMDLYYTNLFEVREMRDYIVTKNNCDDIGLNWLVQYYYPELKTINIDGNIQNISPRIGQTTGKSHYPFRTQCIQQFTEIFGVSLRYIPLNDGYPGMEQRTIPLKKEIVLARKEYLEKHVIKEQVGSNAQEAALTFQNAIDSAPSTASTSTAASVNQPSLASGERRQYEKRIETLSNDLQAARKQLQLVKNQPPPDPTGSPDAIKLSEQLRATLHWRSYFELAMAIIILFLIWRLCEAGEKQVRPRPIRLQSNESNDLDL